MPQLSRPGGPVLMEMLLRMKMKVHPAHLPDLINRYREGAKKISGVVDDFVFDFKGICESYLDYMARFRITNMVVEEGVLILTASV